MGKTNRTMLGGLLALVAAVPTGAMTVEEVIDKHVEARGGKQAWEAIETMKVTGEFTAYSESKPFTLQRRRDNLYHMDHQLGSKHVVVGYDGETAWWDNAWLQKGAQEIAGPDLQVVLRDTDFISPFYDYRERGFEAELLGQVDVEGIPAIGIALTRPDGKETWYLDPKTYLEIAKDSPGSDFGRPMEQRTWYEDFRDVEGVKIPFFAETQWYTRDRVMRVAAVEVNVPVEPSIFTMPKPLGMGPLLPLAGMWDVEGESRQQPGAPWTPRQRQASIEPMVKGAMLQETFTTAEGTEVVRTFSYDKFRECYRMTSISDTFAFLDVLEGALDEQGRLVLTNTDTDTPAEMFGMKIHSRVSIFEISDEGFRLEHEVSIDGGENWFLSTKETYSRSAG